MSRIQRSQGYGYCRDGIHWTYSRTDPYAAVVMARSRTTQRWMDVKNYSYDKVSTKSILWRRTPLNALVQPPTLRYS